MIEFSAENIGFDDLNIKKISPWVIRLELDSKNMTGRNLNIEQIDNKLHEEINDGQINIVRLSELQQDSGKLTLRLRFTDFFGDDDGEETVPILLKQFEEKLLNYKFLKRIPEISKASYTKTAPYCKKKVYDPVTVALKVSKVNWIIETDGVALKKFFQSIRSTD
jgi:DNA-directed RNA polymerase II subunit RPB1